MRFFTFHYMPYQGLDAVQAIDDYGVDGARSRTRCVTLGSWRRTTGTTSIRRRWLTSWASTASRSTSTTKRLRYDAESNVMAGAIAERTTRARIAVFGNALPLRSTPLSSIEEYP